ncbi:hypothetical protein L218DRAFT_944728 [Marasmius fiardii PR-910]|nr:hypothetical protein L218DRAFT_944728 [Marasmius fiardii PR-910]
MATSNEKNTAKLFISMKNQKEISLNEDSDLKNTFPKRPANTQQSSVVHRLWDQMLSEAIEPEYTSKSRMRFAKDDADMPRGTNGNLTLGANCQYDGRRHMGQGDLVLRNHLARSAIQYGGAMEVDKEFSNLTMSDRGTKVRHGGGCGFHSNVYHSTTMAASALEDSGLMKTGTAGSGG